MPEVAETTKAKPISNGETAAPAKSGGGYGARAGEIIAGNLARGGDGKFTSAGNASAAKPPAATGRRAVDLQKRKPATPKKGRAAAKPKKGPKGPDPAKAAERARRRAEAAAKRAQREADKKKRDQEAQQKKLDRAVQNEMKRREQLAKRAQREADRQKRAAERTARRAAADAKRQAAADKPKGGGSGKGGAAKPKPAKEPASPQVTTPELANLTKRLSGGEDLSTQDATALIRNGLARRDRSGALSLTVQGLRATRQKSTDTQAAGQGDAVRTEARTIEPSRRKSFAVFKDHAGRLRWLAVSSTAFQDRDGEIVSVKALEDDVARSDATGQYGPLRFWHVPGLDIGDCDFRAVHGRSLIESGTFRDERYAAAVKDGDQVSLGFLHTLDQPTSDKIFEAIHTFERSVTPAGRASNPFTRLTIQEVQVLTKEKQDELANRVGPDILETLLAQVQQSEKTADAAGVRHKESARVAVWDETIGGWSEVTTKAPAGDEPPEPVEPIAVELDEEPVEESIDDGVVYVGDMTPEEFGAMLTASLAPLIEALNVETKIRGTVDELKGMVGQYATQKDAAIAEQAAVLATVKAEAESINTRLKQLEGDQPRGAGYRPSEAKDNLVGEASALKAAQPTADPNFLQFFNFGQ